MIAELKSKYRSANNLMKLIYLNIIVFVALKILHTIGYMMGLGSFDVGTYIALPSSLKDLAFKPWTIISYMFGHFGFIHLLFNMLWLYLAGQLFLQYFNAKKLVSLYILGGVAGAISYLIAFNLFPVFSNTHSSLIGASASALAILFAIAYQVPNYKINLMFVGPVALKYIAGISLLIDIVSIPESNAGGHIAHIGGAMLGLYFIHQWKKGKDILEPYERFIEGLFKKSKKAPLKTVHKRAKTDQEYRNEKAERSQKVDEILDKIAKSGYDSLSSAEKDFLFKNSKKH